MAKEKQDILKMAEELGLKKENVEFGLKTEPDKIEKAISNAHKLKFKGK